MAFPSISNLTGANPGPNSAVLPDTVQMPTGNLWKVGDFSLTSKTWSALAAGPSVAEQLITASGIGLLVGDMVSVSYNGAQTTNVAIVSARVSAGDTLAVTFLATTGTPTPAALTATNPLIVSVFRVQPNWTVPTSGSQLDW